MALAGCGSAKPTKTQLAKRCGQRAADSLTPGFGGSEREALEQQVARAAEDYYLQSGKCSAG